MLGFRIEVRWGFASRHGIARRCFGGYHGYKHGGSKVKGLCYQKLRINVWPSQLGTDQARPAELVRNKHPPSFSTLPGQEVAPTASHLLPHPVSKEAPKISFPKEMATHCSILAWEIPWTEEPGGLQSMGSQRVRRDLATKQQWHSARFYRRRLRPHLQSPACCLRSISFLHSLMTAVVSLRGCDEYHPPSTTEPQATDLQCNLTEYCLLEVFQWFPITSWPPSHTLPNSLFSISLCPESTPLFLLANSSKSFKAWVQPTPLSVSLPRLPNLISKPFSAPKLSFAGPYLGPGGCISLWLMFPPGAGASLSSALLLQVLNHSHTWHLAQF